MVHEVVHITSLIFKYVDNGSFHDCFIVGLCPLKGQNTWSLKSCVVIDSVPLWIHKSKVSVDCPVFGKSYWMIVNLLSIIFDALRDLVSSVQLRKREKTPMEECYF